MTGKLTTQALAQMLGGEVVGRGDLALGDLAPIDDAKPGCLTFIRSPEYARRWADSHASAALVTRGIEVPGHDARQRALIYVDNADRALVALLEQLGTMAAPPAPPLGVHPTAVVDPSASIDPGASVGPLCVIGPDARVEAGAVLHPRVTLGRGARIGRGSVLHPGVVLYHGCVVGERCILHANVSIGADGFGYIPHPSGKGHVKIPHLGNVVIGDDVEIGAGTCIDRAKFGSTTVGDGAKMDNLVQVGHGVSIGRHAILCGQVGIAGSCSVGEGAVLGGQVGVGDNLRIGVGARIGGQGGLTKDLPPGETWWGTPARPITECLRSQAAMLSLAQNMRELRRRLKALEQDLANHQP